MARPTPKSQARIDGRFRPATLLLAAVSLAACRPPSAGVLTLAPAGMHTTAACVAQPDGTLTMPPRASADSMAYVDAGTVTITVTAAPSSLQQRPQIEVWLADAKVGTAMLQSAGSQSIPFHARARASAVTSVRLVYLTDAGDGESTAPTLHVEKVVIRQP